jgi:succinate-acetate transporter protein
MADEVRPTQVVADPAPLGLAGFALTTFVLSAHNAGLFGTVGNAIVIGLAIFYGGVAQFMAGMWEFRNKNTFGATAFSTYGAFWLAFGTYLLLITFGKIPAGDIAKSVGFFLLAFAIFNTYMMLWAARLNWAVFGVFLTLEVTEIVLFLGFFSGSDGLIKLGGWLGILTALVAWYTSAAGVVNSMATKPFLPVGTPIWTAKSAGDRERVPVRR